MSIGVINSIRVKQELKSGKKKCRDILKITILYMNMKLADGEPKEKGCLKRSEERNIRDFGKKQYH
jgi:hypothetical protein